MCFTFSVCLSPRTLQARPSLLRMRGLDLGISRWAATSLPFWSPSKKPFCENSVQSEARPQSCPHTVCGAGPAQQPAIACRTWILCSFYSRSRKYPGASAPNSSDRDDAQGMRCPSGCKGSQGQGVSEQLKPNTMVERSWGVGRTRTSLPFVLTRAAARSITMAGAAINRRSTQQQNKQVCKQAEHQLPKWFLSLPFLLKHR